MLLALAVVTNAGQVRARLSWRGMRCPAINPYVIAGKAQVDTAQVAQARRGLLPCWPCCGTGSSMGSTLCKRSARPAAWQTARARSPRCWLGCAGGAGRGPRGGNRPPGRPRRYYLLTAAGKNCPRRVHPGVDLANGQRRCPPRRRTERHDMTDDQIAAAYLKRLRRAARTLPRARRRELLEAIEAHIAEARAAGAVPLRGVLDDLGAPGDIVTAWGGGVRVGPGRRQIAAVVLLLVGAGIFTVGWVAGVVLLWTSDRWRWYDKLLGTLIWPGGLLVIPVFAAGLAVSSTGGEVCGGGTAQWTACVTQGGGVLPGWLGIVIAVVVVAAPVAVAIRLLRRAARTPEQAGPLVPSP